MRQMTRRTMAGKQKSERRAMFGGTRGWLAGGTVAAYAVRGGTMFAVAEKEKSDPAGSSASEATLPLKKFDIAPRRLDKAVEAYEKATGLTVKIVLPAGTLAGFNSPGVAGLYREDEALRLLLEGTGLNYRVEDATTMLVGIQARDTVSVTDSVTNSISLTQFTEPLLNTAQSITVIPQLVLKDEGVTTLRDTLRNVPGISLAAGEAGAQGDNLTIRGFTARNDIFLDGIRYFDSYYRDTFNYEQVEALEGPAGIQFGRGSTGGVVNQESKAPTVQQFAHVQAHFGTDATRRITADVNHPILGVLGGSAFRLNAMGQESGVAGRPFAEVRRWGVAPSVSIGLNTKTPATLNYVHLQDNDTPDYGLPWFNNTVAPGPIRHSYYGFPDENYLQTNDDILTLKVEHEFSPSVNLH